MIDGQFLLVGGAVASAVATLALVAYLLRYHTETSAQWFAAALLAQALFCLSYGFSLLVFEPAFRLVLEIITLVVLCATGPLFLAFALSYTGRGELLRTPVVAVLALPPATVALCGVTVQQHELLWTEFELAPVFGAATVSYTLQPLALTALLFGFAAAGVGILLLIETILSYGKPYRKETTAVALSTVPPSIGLIIWILGVGPTPQLNLAAVLFLPHAALDAYAFVGTHMFNSNPTTRRLAERQAVPTLTQPVIVFDGEGQVVYLNERAMEAFAVTEAQALLKPVSAVTGTPVADIRERNELHGPNRREFAVSYSPLSDANGEFAGGLLILSDITTERRREQRLAVMNRVLRHNLRNKLSTIQLRGELIESEATDDRVVESARAIQSESDSLGATAEKARTFERAQASETHLKPVRPGQLAMRCAEAFDRRYPDAAISCALETEREIRTDPVLLELVIENIIENAIEHTEQNPTVAIQVTDGDERAVTITVRDTAAQIPRSELEPIKKGKESALEHGSGIGLWIIHWCVQGLNGTIEFAYDEGNVITLSVPPVRQPRSERRVRD